MLTSVGHPPIGQSRIAATLTKPLRRAQLFDAIASAAGREARFPADDGQREEAERWRAPPGLRALVVEDNPVNQRVVSTMLGRFGFRTDVVADGDEAVTAVSNLPYDVVLMDCHMPKMNGYDATAEIRRQEVGHVPIVALTASALKGDAERCLAAGMDAYVAKPVRLEDLAEALAALFDDRTSPVETVAGPELSAATGILDLEAVERNRALGRHVLESIVSDFRSGAPEDIAELERALAAADADQVVEASHRLRGGCLILGATRLGALAAEVEANALDGRLERVAELVPSLQRALDDLLAALETAL